jgi:hypothetical protein
MLHHLCSRLESVQRRAARFATGNYNTTSSVTTMLNHLNWDTLQQRRLRTKAIMMYRIVNGLVAIEPPPFIHHLGAATRGQQHKYIVPYSRTTVHKSNKLFRRSCAYKVHGQTDGQGNSYIPPSQTLFADGIKTYTDLHPLKKTKYKTRGSGEPVSLT